MSKYKDIIIACDMDDTIEYLVPAWIKWLNNKYGTKVIYDDIVDWDITKAFPTLQKEQVFAPLRLEAFWETVEPMKDAQYYIPKLIEEGFQFYIVTSAPPDTIIHKFNKCLKVHFPYLDWKHVIIAKNKQLIRCDVLIDDGEHNIVGPYIGLLKDTPHNRDFEASNVYHVKDWKEIYTKIHNIFD